MWREWPGETGGGGGRQISDWVQREGRARWTTLCSGFLRSLISEKRSPWVEFIHMQMALFLRSIYRSSSFNFFFLSIRSFRAIFSCRAPSYIRQTVSFTALGDITIIFQPRERGLTRWALDPWQENLSFLNCADSFQKHFSPSSLFFSKTTKFPQRSWDANVSAMDSSRHLWVKHSWL